MMKICKPSWERAGEGLSTKSECLPFSSVFDSLLQLWEIESDLETWLLCGSVRTQAREGKI